MITSLPRERRSVPSVSGESIACPPGLSVIESTSMRGSAASSCSVFRAGGCCRPEQPAARDELRGDDERVGLCESVHEEWAFPVSVCLIYHRRMPDLQVLDEATARGCGQVCDAIVPGSARIRPEVYVDALLARMDEGTRGAAGVAAFEKIAEGGFAGHVADAGIRLGVRSLAVEAFYSDFVAPGVDATGAWEEIDFNTPLATRLRKDWSYLGISVSTERFDVVVVGSGAGGRRRRRR